MVILQKNSNRDGIFKSEGLKMFSCKNCGCDMAEANIGFQNSCAKCHDVIFGWC